MNDADKNFFGALAEEKIKADEEYEVELAKAGGSVAQKPKLLTREENRKDYTGDAEGQLTVDVYQTPTEIVVESAIAGVKPEDIDVTVNNDSITIKGERHREKEVKNDDYFYQECYWGKFSRSIILPQEIDAEESSVSFKNGILTLRLPKLDRKKSKKLKVKVE